MTAAEMAFCRAEGALAGWNMDGTAEALYNEGITLSFEQWGASGAADYIANSTATPADYVDAADGYGQAHAKMSSITVKWDDNASASEKMERLMVQKWIPRRPGGLERDPPYGLPEGLPLGTIHGLRPHRAQPSSVRLHGASQQSRQLSESRAAARRS